MMKTVQLCVCPVVLLCAFAGCTTAHKLAEDGSDSGLASDHVPDDQLGDSGGAPGRINDSGVGGSLAGQTGGSGGRAAQGSTGGTLPSVQGQAWTGSIACSGTSTFWPFGAKGVVSLTYDDALTSPVRHALPALDAHGFKATFFLTTKNVDPSFWKPLAHSGHELASHTVTHTANITQAAMAKEVVASLATIKALDVEQPRFSFAYPNGQPNGSDGSYKSVVLQYTLAARGLNGASQKLGVPVDYGNVPSRILSATDDLPAIINETLAQHAWTTFVVHGIEDDLYLNIPKAKHDELVALLAAKGKDLWVAPFITVADYMQRCQK